MAFSVLFVCTGNICRSPMAERLFRVRSRPGVPTYVTSSGTRALVGYGIDEPSAIALRELGVAAGAHKAKQITEELVTGADLILTAAAVHRSTIVKAWPLAFRHCFTMREFGRLAASADLGPGLGTIADLQQRVAFIAGQRGQAARLVHPADDDIADPYGQPFEVARACARSVANAIDGVHVGLDLAGGSA